MKRIFIFCALYLIGLGLLLFASCSDKAQDFFYPEPPAPPAPQMPPELPAPYAKEVSFSVCEDYDKNQDLKDIAKDFALANELGIDTMRVSFGWDDYEPEQDKFDFAWLHKFCNLAEQHGIKLRPYLCYAPNWATGGGWNDPPKDFKDWYDYCYRIADELKVHPNILSYEIWNEEDIDMWFGGTTEEFKQVLEQGASAVRAADPDKEILLGGVTRPADDLLLAIVEAGLADYYDVLPIHCYVETWSSPRDKIEEYLTHHDFKWFSDHNRTMGGSKPIWINEIGYSTMNRSEKRQANYMCRAVAHLFSSPDVVHIGWYEIKDLYPESSVIGDEHNYYLGITTWPDRKPKLAFHTLDMLTDLLDGKTVTPDNAGAEVKAADGETHRLLYHYLFKFEDGGQLLFVYDMSADLTVDITLKTPGSSAVKYELDNTYAAFTDFDGTTLKGVKLPKGQVQIFKIEP